MEETEPMVPTVSSGLILENWQVEDITLNKEKNDINHLMSSIIS